MPLLRIDLTKDDIRRSRRTVFFCQPLERAIGRATGFHRLEVSHDRVVFGNHSFPLPVIAKSFARLWARNYRVEPMSFDMDVDLEVIGA